MIARAATSMECTYRLAVQELNDMRDVKHTADIAAWRPSAHSQDLVVLFRWLEDIQAYAILYDLTWSFFLITTRIDTDYSIIALQPTKMKEMSSIKICRYAELV
jgi:hypothetical protein